jgi:arylsulfatase A-like enzyme
LNVVFITIDSLSKHFLKTYGQTVEFEVETPNLDRFAGKAAVFDNHYAGSLPCMPARREFFAGIQEFLWRPWGPMEPFDVPAALAARRSGIVTQLVTDHYHYFQHGSSGYFEDYGAFDFIRGHEYDAWKTTPKDPDGTLMRQILAGDPHNTRFMDRAQYARNAAHFTKEEDFLAPQVFARTAEWLKRNRGWEKWFLVVDSFDVHEPFHVPEPYASMYTDEDPNDPELTNWPYYGRIDEGQSALTERQLAFVRAQYAGKLTMVDRWFGRVLDALDELKMWDETAVIVTSDHGHFLGDHGWMGKPNAPLYNVLAATPLFIWHPGGARNGERTDALTSAVDLYATMLEAAGAEVPEHVHSRSLMPIVKGETDRHRNWALYGYWGSTVNVTDGRHTYLRPCRDDVDAYTYSTRMMNPHGWFVPPKPQKQAEAGRYLPYTDTPVWRYPEKSYTRHAEPLLFDIAEDPEQRENLAGRDPESEERMRRLLVEALRELRAPEEQYARLGLK